MNELFETKIGTPLAERLRADSLADVVGQEHILGDDGIITNQLKSGNIKSMILWGPPGCGKTTILYQIMDDLRNDKSVDEKHIIFLDLG